MPSRPTEGHRPKELGEKQYSLKTGQLVVQAFSKCTSTDQRCSNSQSCTRLACRAHSMFTGACVVQNRIFPKPFAQINANHRRCKITRRRNKSARSTLVLVVEIHLSILKTATNRRCRCRTSSRCKRDLGIVRILAIPAYDLEEVIEGFQGRGQAERDLIHASHSRSQAHEQYFNCGGFHCIQSSTRQRS